MNISLFLILTFLLVLLGSTSTIIIISAESNNSTRFSHCGIYIEPEVNRELTLKITGDNSNNTFENPCPRLEIRNKVFDQILVAAELFINEIIIRNCTLTKHLDLRVTPNHVENVSTPESQARIEHFLKKRSILVEDVIFNWEAGREEEVDDPLRSAGRSVVEIGSNEWETGYTYFRSLIIRNCRIRRLKPYTATSRDVSTSVPINGNDIAFSESLIIHNNTILSSNTAMRLNRASFADIPSDYAGITTQTLQVTNNRFTYTDELLHNNPGDDENSIPNFFREARAFDISTDALRNKKLTTSTGKAVPSRFIIQGNNISATFHHRHHEQFHLIPLSFESTISYRRKYWPVSNEQLELLDEAIISNNNIFLDGHRVRVEGQSFYSVFDIREIHNCFRRVNIFRNNISYHMAVSRVEGFYLQNSKNITKDNLVKGDLEELSIIENEIDLRTELDNSVVNQASIERPRAIALLSSSVNGLVIQAVMHRRCNVMNISSNNLKRIQNFRPFHSPAEPESAYTITTGGGISVKPCFFVAKLVINFNIINFNIQANPKFLNAVAGIGFPKSEDVLVAGEPFNVSDCTISGNFIRTIGSNNAATLVSGWLSEVRDLPILEQLVVEDNTMDIRGCSIVPCSFCFNEFVPALIEKFGLPSQIRDEIKRAKSPTVFFAAVSSSSSSSENAFSIRSNDLTLSAPTASSTTSSENSISEKQFLPIHTIFWNPLGKQNEPKSIQFINNSQTIVDLQQSVSSPSSSLSSSVFPAIMFFADNLLVKSLEIKSNKQFLNTSSSRRTIFLPMTFNILNSEFSPSASSTTIDITSNTVLQQSSSNDANNNNNNIIFSNQLLPATYNKLKGSFVSSDSGVFVIEWMEDVDTRIDPPTGCLLRVQNCSSSTTSSESTNNDNGDISVNLRMSGNVVNLATHDSAVNQSRLVEVTSSTPNAAVFSNIALKGNTLHLLRSYNERRCPGDDFDFVKLPPPREGVHENTMVMKTELDISQDCNHILYYNGETSSVKLLNVSSSFVIVNDAQCKPEQEKNKCDDENGSSRTKSQSKSSTFDNDNNENEEYIGENAIGVSSEVSAALTTTSVVQSLSMASMAVGAAATPALGFSIGRQQAMMNFALKAQQGDCRGLMPGTVSDSNEEEVDYSLPVADSPTQMKIGTQHPSSPAAPFYVGAVVGNFVMILGIVLLNQLIGHIATKIIIKKYCRPSDYNKKKDLWKNYFYVFANSFVSLSLFYMIAILLSPTLTSAVSILAGTSNEVVSVGVKIVCFLIAGLISSVGVYFVVWSTCIRKPRREVYRINTQEQEDEKKKNELGVIDLFKKLCKADGEWKIPLNERTTKETHSFQISEPCYTSYRVNQWFAIVEIVVAVSLCLPPLFAQLASSGRSSCIVHGVLLFLILLVYTILLIWKNPNKLKIMRFFVPAMAVQQTLVVGMTLIAVLTTSEDDSKSDNVGAREWLWKTIFAPLGFEIVLAVVSAVSSVFPFLVFLKKISAKILAAKKGLGSSGGRRESSFSTPHHHHRKENNKNRHSERMDYEMSRRHRSSDRHHHHRDSHHRHHTHHHHHNQTSHRKNLKDFYPHEEYNHRNEEREMSLLPKRRNDSRGNASDRRRNSNTRNEHERDTGSRQRRETSRHLDEDHHRRRSDEGRNSRTSPHEYYSSRSSTSKRRPSSNSYEQRHRSF